MLLGCFVFCEVSEKVLRQHASFDQHKMRLGWQTKIVLLREHRKFDLWVLLQLLFEQ